MRRVRAARLLVFVAGLVAAPIGAARGQDIILDSAQGPLFPRFRDRMGPLEAEAPRPGLPAGAPVFRIKEVFNIQGNNPFNRTQPLLNFNGQIIGSIAELEAIVKGRAFAAGAGTGAALSACVGSVNFGAPPGVPPGFLFASIDLNPVTLACTLRSDSDGRTLIFESAPGQLGAFSPAGTFVLESPPPPAQMVFGTPRTFVVRATANGRRFRITAVANQIGGGVIRLTVTEVTQL